MNLCTNLLYHQTQTPDEPRVWQYIVKKTGSGIMSPVGVPSRTSAMDHFLSTHPATSTNHRKLEADIRRQAQVQQTVAELEVQYGQERAARALVPEQQNPLPQVSQSASPAETHSDQSTTDAHTETSSRVGDPAAHVQSIKWQKDTARPTPIGTRTARTIATSYHPQRCIESLAPSSSPRLSRLNQGTIHTVVVCKASALCLYTREYKLGVL